VTTAWTRTAGSICNEGLQQLGVLAAGQTANAEDFQAALDALGAVLKELPVYGYAWPALSSETTLTWSSGTPGSVSLPDDFYGYPVVYANGVPLQPLRFTDWADLPSRMPTTDGAPSGFYVSPDNVLRLYPVPTTDPVLTVLYQRIVPDVASGDSTGLSPYWVNALGYGVANELLFKYGIPEPRASRIEKRWEMKKALALASSVSNEAISHQVADDYRPWGPGNWQAPAPIPDGYDAGGEP
jgi:hypothetical protein